MDCPTCGRSIRVPGLDGRIAPLPERKPSIELEDPSLVQALDELVSLGSGEFTNPPSLDQSPAEQIEPLELPPLEIKVVQDLPVAEPAVPIDVPVVRTPPSEHNDLTTGERASDRHRPVDPPAGSAEFSNSGVLAALATVSDAESSIDEESVLRPLKAPPARKNSRMPVLICLFAGLGVGFVAGWFARPQTVNSPPDPGSTTEPNDQQDIRSDAPKPPSNEPSVVPVPVGGVYGTIQFLDSTGQLRADVGARIVILPQMAAGSIRLDATAIRSAVDGLDFKMTQAALKSAGGELMLTDDYGQFQTSLANGSYRIVVISNSVSSPAGAEIPAELNADWLRFFDRSNPILVRLKSHSQLIDVNDKAATEVNHRFDSSN